MAATRGPIMSTRQQFFLLMAVAWGVPSPARAGNDLHGDPLPAGAIARLGTIRFRYHTFRTPHLAFSRDGQALVAAGEGVGIRVWDSTTGRVVRETPLGKFQVTGFALSPDGKLAAVGGYGHEKPDENDTNGIRLVEVATGKVRRTLERKDGLDQCALAFTPDGKHLASVGRDGVVRIEEVETGTELLQERFRVGSARLAFSADGTALAVCGSAGSAFVWDWQSGKPPREIKVPPRGAHSVSFSPDGKVLATGADSLAGVRLWEVSTGKLLKTLKPTEESDSSQAIFSPDGRHLAGTSYHHKAVILWDPKTGKELRRIPVAGRYPRALAWSNDSRRLAVVDGAVIRVFEAATGKETPVLPEGHRQTPGIVALLADGTAMTAGDDGTARLWESATGKHRRTIRVTDSWVRGARVSPDGRWLVASTLGQDHAVSLWNLKTGRLVFREPGHGRLGGKRAVAFSADGKRFLSWGDDMYSRTWDIRNGKAVAEQAIRPDGQGVPDLDEPGEMDMKSSASDSGAFSPDGGLLVLGGWEGFFVFDTKTGKQVRKIEHPQGHVAKLAVSPDGKFLLTSAWGRSRQIKLPDGRMRSSSGDGVLTLHDLTTGKLVRESKHALHSAGPVAFSADGKWFAAASSDQDSRIAFHDTATGALRGAIDRVPGRVWSLGLSPDGKRVIVGLSDTTALVYPVPEKAAKK
jgi:WD40 repeat protein